MNMAAEQTAQPATPPETGYVEPNWGELNAGLDTVEEVTVEGDLEVLPETAGAEPAAVAVAEPEPPEPAPAPTAVATAAVAPTASTWTPPPAPTFDQVAYEAELAERTKAEQEKLLEAYKLSPEEAQQMLTEPEVVMPKLLARMHMQAQQAAIEAMQQSVPQVLEATTRAQRTEEEARRAFYSVNEDLDKPEYVSAVLQVGAMYRQVNPNAPREQAVKVIGEMARVALGLPPKGATVATPQPSPTPVPFTPARGGAGASVPVAKNVWSDLAKEFAEE